MLLNVEYHQSNHAEKRAPIVLIHGLFGSLSNLGMLARTLQQSYDIVQIDVRNHGKSAHSSELNYPLMATDIVETLDHLNIDQFSVIGHSMGGKIAMQLTGIAPQRLQQLVVLDMAPFAYQEHHHDQIFQALFAVEQAQIESRKDAQSIMQQYIQEEMVIQFLLKSFSKGKWLFNVAALHQHYAEIIGWTRIPQWHKPTLFIRGEKSAYVMMQNQVDAIDQQFTDAELNTVTNTGHWLHAENPAVVLEMIQHYLNQQT